MLNCQQKLYFREIDRDFLAVQDKAIHTYKFAVALSECVFRRKFGTKALNNLKRLYFSTLDEVIFFWGMCQASFCLKKLFCVFETILSKSRQFQNHFSKIRHIF